MGKKNLEIVNAEGICETLLKDYFKLKEIKNSKSIKVLDVGCGDQPYRKLIEKLAKEANVKKIVYVGVDFYRTKYSKYNLDLNKDKMPLSKNEFDLVICTEVLEHLSNPIFVLDQMKVLVKQKGHILITTPFLYPVHEVEHDYFRFTHHFYSNYFREFKFIKHYLSNTVFSYILYAIISCVKQFTFIGYKYLKYLQMPFDLIGTKLFKNREITYSYYVAEGLLVKKNGKK